MRDSDRIQKFKTNKYRKPNIRRYCPHIRYIKENARFSEHWTRKIEKMNMQINIYKSKTLIINKHLTHNEQREIKCKDEIIQNVTTYHYHKRWDI